MKKILINTSVSKMLADLYTPVGIYLRLRDRFRDTILLESTDHHVAENSYSFICINAIAGIEVRDAGEAEYKLPGQEPQHEPLAGKKIEDVLYGFMQHFETETSEPKAAAFAQGLYGYCTFDLAFPV